MRTILLAALLISAPAWASGDCKGQSCNGGGDVSTGDVSTDVTTEVTNNVTGGDTSIIGGDTSLETSTKTFAFSHSLGGVSIEDCLASTQWGTILFSKQKVVLNKWCAAEVYDSKGLHEMAALTRCDIEEIAKFFPSREECVEANRLHPAIDVDLVRRQDEVIREQRMEIEDLSGQVAEIREEMSRPKPAPVQRVIQQEYLSESKRAALRAVLEEE